MSTNFIFESKSFIWPYKWFVAVCGIFVSGLKQEIKKEAYSASL